jgi:hypothetical protein
MSASERLERLETSHVRLMTEHEVLFREYEVFIGHHKEWLREYDARCERDRDERREMGKDLDRRILELVSGIGEFLRQAKR